MIDGEVELSPGGRRDADGNFVRLEDGGGHAATPRRRGGGGGGGQ